MNSKREVMCMSQEHGGPNSACFYRCRHRTWAHSWMAVQSNPIYFADDYLCHGYKLLEMNFPTCVSSHRLYFRGLAAYCHVSRELGEPMYQHHSAVLTRGTKHRAEIIPSLPCC